MSESKRRSGTEKRGRRWVIPGGLGVALLLAGIWATSPASVSILNVVLHAEQSNVIGLEVASCHGDLTVSTVETDATIEVLVEDHRFRLRLSGDDCAEGVQVELDQPVHDRILVDASTGEQIGIQTDSS